MRILLLPNEATSSNYLIKFFNKAFKEAMELFIVSAYLTEWNPGTKLNKNCEELSFIVGTDFGITTKDACRKVLKWLPESMKNDFLAADAISGFHPKLIMWKDESDQCNLLLGSSNLTQAAVTTNYEANVLTKISKEQYDIIRDWVYSIRLACSPISEDWLDSYKEATRVSKPSGKGKTYIIQFNLPSGKDIDKAISRRRKQQKAFASIKDELTMLIKRCASSKISNKKFYEGMMDLWGSHKSRFQGRGFEIAGKHSKWKEVCKSILSVLSKSDTATVLSLDTIVKKEVDYLNSRQNPNRGAWLSEMLCHYFPDRYPLVNKPVKVWLQHNKYRHPRGSSEGARYIDLSIKLRHAIKSNVANRAKNLAELDHAIWQWYDNTYNVE